MSFNALGGWCRGATLTNNPVQPLRANFGTWRYEISNQDDCFLQSTELAGRMILGERDPTVCS
jgi:hypothetical protein